MSRPSPDPLRFGLKFAVLLVVVELAFRALPDAPDGPRVEHDVFIAVAGAARVDEAIDRLPIEESRSIVVLGASQIRAVKGRGRRTAVAIAPRIAAYLSERDDDRVVVDASNASQNVLESRLALEAIARRTSVDLVVLGITPINLTSSRVRPEMVALLDDARRPGRHRRFAEPWLAEGPLGSLAMIDRAEWTMSRIVGPVIRGRWIRDTLARASGVPIARTHRDVGSTAEGFTHLERIAQVARMRAASLVVVLLPVDRSRPPRPFPEQAEEAFRAEIRRVAAIERFAVLDLSEALPVDHFGLRGDGSPDHFHFDARGHALVFEALLPSLERTHRRERGTP